MTSDLEIAEGVAGVWFYHLRRPGEFLSLCGKPVMSTSLRLETWGMKSPHIGEGYCKTCGAHLPHEPKEKTDE